MTGMMVSSWIALRAVVVASPGSVYHATTMCKERFACKRCGSCCLNLTDAFQTCATEEDVRRWEEAGRDDILKWVDPIVIGDTCVYDIWVSPRTGDDVSRCPWLLKVRGTDAFVCRIHDLKPELCRNYPKSRQHAEATGCPGF